jgi:hypothetical protein
MCWQARTHARTHKPAPARAQVVNGGGGEALIVDTAGRFLDSGWGGREGLGGMG